VYAFNVYLKQLDGTLVNKIGNISLVRWGVFYEKDVKALALIFL
jgi:hypothetical protein